MWNQVDWVKAQRIENANEKTCYLMATTQYVGREEGRNNEFPTDVNEAFVIAHEASNRDEDLSFRFVLSTPLLLEECAKQKNSDRCYLLG